MPPVDAEPVVAPAQNAPERSAGSKPAARPPNSRWASQQGASSSLRFGYNQFQPPTASAPTQIPAKAQDEEDRKKESRHRVIFRHTMTSDFVEQAPQKRQSPGQKDSSGPKNGRRSPSVEPSEVSTSQARAASNVKVSSDPPAPDSTQHKLFPSKQSESTKSETASPRLASGVTNSPEVQITHVAPARSGIPQPVVPQATSQPASRVTPQVTPQGPPAAVPHAPSSHGVSSTPDTDANTSASTQNPSSRTDSTQTTPAPGISTPLSSAYTASNQTTAALLAAAQAAAALVTSSQSGTPQNNSYQSMVPPGTTQDSSKFASPQSAAHQFPPIPFGPITPLHPQYSHGQQPLGLPQPIALPNSLPMGMQMPLQGGMPFPPASAWYPASAPQQQDPKATQSPTSASTQAAQLQQWQMMQNYIPDINALLQFQRTLIIQQLVQTGLTLEQIQLLTAPTMIPGMGPYAVPGGTSPSQASPFQAKGSGQPNAQQTNPASFTSPSSSSNPQSHAQSQSSPQSLAQSFKLPQILPENHLHGLMQSQPIRGRTPNSLPVPPKDLQLKPIHQLNLPGTPSLGPLKPLQLPPLTGQRQEQKRAPIQILHHTPPALKKSGVKRSSQGSPKPGSPSPLESPSPPLYFSQEPSPPPGTGEKLRRTYKKRRPRMRKQPGTVFYNYSVPGKPAVKSELEGAKSEKGKPGRLKIVPGGKLEKDWLDREFQRRTQLHAKKAAQAEEPGSESPSDKAVEPPDNESSLSIPLSLQKTTPKTLNVVEEKVGKATEDSEGSSSPTPTKKSGSPLAFVRSSASTPIFTVRAAKRKHSNPTSADANDTNAKGESSNRLGPGLLSGLTSRLKADISSDGSNSHGLQFGKFSTRMGKEKQKEFKFSYLDAQHYAHESAEGKPKGRRNYTKPFMSEEFQQADSIRPPPKREARFILECPAAAMQSDVLKIKPSLLQPAVVQPAAVQPAVVQPLSATPAVDNPAVNNPAVEKPAVEKPAVEKPTMDEPAVEKPEGDSSGGEDMPPSKKLRSQRRAAVATQPTPSPTPVRSARTTRQRASYTSAPTLPVIPSGAPPPVMPLFTNSDDEGEEEDEGGPSESDNPSESSSSAEESDYSSKPTPRSKTAGRRQLRKKR